MVDAVSPVMMQGASASRTSAQRSSETSVAAAPVSTSASAAAVAFRIRVDNLQNIAVLEYVNGSGQVVEQYPTQTQIEAFRHAERAAEAVHTEGGGIPAPTTGEHHAAPVVSEGTPAPAPAPAAPVAHTGGGSTGGKTSVIA